MSWFGVFLTWAILSEEMFLFHRPYERADHGKREDEHSEHV